MTDFRKPTDIITQETDSLPSASQAKGSKSISIGSFGFSKKGLVAVKPKLAPALKPEVKASTSKDQTQTPSKNSGLTLLGSYGSDSDTDSD